MDKHGNKVRRFLRWTCLPLAIVVVYAGSDWRARQQAVLDGRLWQACCQLDVRQIQTLLRQGANPNAYIPTGAVLGSEITHGSRVEQWLRRALHLPAAVREVPFTIFHSMKATLEKIDQPEYWLQRRMVDRAAMSQPETGDLKRAHDAMDNRSKIIDLLHQAGGK